MAAAALALPLALLTLTFVPFGVEPAVAELAGQFVLWRLPGLPFLFLYVGGRAYLAAAGHTRPMVIATVVANLRQPAAQRAAGLRRRRAAGLDRAAARCSRRWAAPARPSAAA